VSYFLREKRNAVSIAGCIRYVRQQTGDIASLFELLNFLFSEKNVFT
tara:strand:+ start:30544 stop:30684 length:141 start_codon:yes stop_codon:yes gene_type:complete